MNPRLSGVIEAAATNRARFAELCRSLNAEELARPIPGSHWQVKDYISHLATIDEFVNEWFGAMADGRRWVPRSDDGAPFSIDRWNDDRVLPLRDRSVDEIFDIAATRRAEIVQTFMRLTDETLERRFVFREKEMSYLDYLEAWTLHDPAHAIDMFRALPERKDERDRWLTLFDPARMNAVADVSAKMP